VPDRCSKTVTPLKPIEPPATIALPSAPLPPRPYKRRRRHAHQSMPLFRALAPLICAHIASPLSFNHRHHSSLVAGKILSLCHRFLPVVRFTPPLSILEPSRRAPVAGAAWERELRQVHRPTVAMVHGGPTEDRGLGSRIFSTKINKFVIL
jgi:hypothetical protein